MKRMYKFIDQRTEAALSYYYMLLRREHVMRFTDQTFSDSLSSLCQGAAKHDTRVAL